MKRVYEILGIIVGSLITAIGINSLILPAKLLSGGVTGIAIIVAHYLPLSVAMMYFVFNIPLLILGYIHIGRKFSIYTILSVVLVSIFMSVIHIHKVPTNQTLLAAIFGGMISSIGGAIVLRSGGSQGGLDVVGRVIAKYKNISVGKISLVINAIIVIISALLFGVQLAMYTLIAMFVGSKTYEVLLNHVDRISVTIISEKGEEIAQTITQKMQRGVTMWQASGAYTKVEKKVLFCVVVNVQLTELKQIVAKVDEKAFIAISPMREVFGNFNRIW